MTTYRADNAAILYIGRYASASPFFTMPAVNTQARFRVFGKSLSLHVNVVVSGTGTMKYSIDGGAFTTYNFGSTGDVTTSDILAAGTDGWHDIIIQQLGSGGNFKFYLADAIQVTADTTAQIATPTDNWTVSRLGNTSEFTNLVSNATLGSNKRGHTFSQANASFGYSTPSAYLSAFQDESIRFRASCSKIAIWTNDGTWLLFRDGSLVGSPVVAPSGFGLTELSSSEDGFEHDYRIIQVKAISTASRIDAVCIIGTFSSTGPTLSKRIAFLGDSTTANIVTTSTSQQGHVAKLIGKHGYVAFNRGVGGNTSAQMLARLSTDVLGIASLYGVVVVSGANDAAADDATLQGTCEDIYRDIIGTDSTIRCVVCEAFPSTSGNREGTVNLAAVTAIDDPRCTYTDTDGWITPATDTHDGQHPNDSGGTKIEAKMQEIIIPADPSEFIATPASSSRINLSWTDDADNETGFLIEMSADGSTGWSEVTTTAANATSYSHTALTANTTYYYRISAINAAGASAYATGNATTESGGSNSSESSASSQSSVEFSSSSSHSSASSSSSNDEQEPFMTTLDTVHNTFPSIFVNDDDAGTISKIDEHTFRYLEVKTIRGPVTVELDSPYANSEIRYTLNGKNPTNTSPKYVGPLVFRQNATGEKTTVKARIYDKTNSNVKSKIIRLEFRVIPMQ